MTATRTSRPDIWGDILAAAWHPGAEPPVAVHVSPALHARLAPEEVDEVPATESGSAAGPAAVPVVLDDEVPEFPGFEVHRERPGGVPGAPR